MSEDLAKGGFFGGLLVIRLVVPRRIFAHSDEFLSIWPSVSTEALM